LKTGVVMFKQMDKKSYLEFLNNIFVPDSEVEYAKYIKFNLYKALEISEEAEKSPETVLANKVPCVAMDYSTLESVTKKLRAYIEGCADYTGLEQLVNRQSDEAWGQVGELISNGIDASIENSEIGRFGIGFKQALQELKHWGARIFVITKSFESSEYGRVLEFSCSRRNKIVIRDAKIRGIQSGTRIIIERKLSGEEQNEIKQYVEKKYQRCPYIRILYNDVLVNDFSQIHAIEGNSIKFISEKTIKISVNENGYEVMDEGKGMNDLILFDHFLLPRQSTKQSAPDGENLYYSTVPMPNERNIIKFMVSGVIIEEHLLSEIDLPSEVIINFPHVTKLSASRSEIIVDKCSLQGIKVLVEKIFSSGECGNKIVLINIIVSVLKLLGMPVRAGKPERELIENLKNDIKNKLASVLESASYYLPRINELKYFDIGTDRVSYLDPTIYPEKIIERIPGIKKIKLFSSDKDYCAYTMPFKASKLGKQPPVYINFGRVLIFDKAIYKDYKDTPEILNFMLNYWIGYGDKPESKGMFEKKKTSFQLTELEEVDVAFNEEEIDEVEDEVITVSTEKEKKYESQKKLEEQKNESFPPECSPSYDRNSIEAHTEQLKKEILRDYQLIEEAIISASRSSSGNYFLGESGSMTHQITQEKVIEEVIGSYISESLEQNVKVGDIKTTVREFLTRYIMLGIKNVGIKENKIDRCDLKIKKDTFHLYDNKQLKKISTVLTIISVARTTTDVYWVAENSDGLQYVYKNSRRMTEGYKHIKYFKTFKQAVCWAVSQDEKWDIYFNEQKICTGLSKISDIQISEHRIAWITEDNIYVFKDGQCVSVIEGCIDNLQITDQDVWWVDTSEFFEFGFRIRKNGQTVKTFTKYLHAFDESKEFFLSVTEMGTWLGCWESKENDTDTSWGNRQECRIYNNNELIASGFDYIMFVGRIEEDIFWLGGIGWGPQYLYKNQMQIGVYSSIKIYPLAEEERSHSYADICSFFCVGRSYENLYDIYFNGTLIGDGFQEIGEVSLFDNTFLGKKNNCWGIYINGELFQKDENKFHDSSIKVSWVSENKESNEDIFHDFSIKILCSVEGALYWARKNKENKWIVYCNNKQVHADFDEVASLPFLIDDLFIDTRRTWFRDEKHKPLALTGSFWFGRRSFIWSLYNQNHLLCEINDENRDSTHDSNVIEKFKAGRARRLNGSDIKICSLEYDLYRINYKDICLPRTLSHIGSPLSTEEQSIVQSFLTENIQQIDSINLNNNIDRYKHGILMYGTLGFPTEVFKQSGMQTAIAILGIWFQWYVQKGYVTPVWLDELFARYKAQPISWWASFWLFFKEFLFFIPDKSSFERLAISWELLYVNDPVNALWILQHEWNAPAEKLKIIVNPVRYSLTRQDQDILFKVIKLSHSPQEKNNLIRAAMLYGNLGSYEIFEHFGWQIGVTILGKKLDHCLEQRFIHAKWLKSLFKQHPKETAKWWQDYWKFFDIVASLIPDQISFQCLATHWEFFYSDSTTRPLIQELMQVLQKEGDELSLVFTTIQSPLTPDQFALVKIRLNEIDDKATKLRYLKAVFIHGNFRLFIEKQEIQSITKKRYSVFNLNIVQLAIENLGVLFADYIEKDFVIPSWLNNLEVYYTSIKQLQGFEAQLFWEVLSALKNDILDKETFFVITERLKIVCFLLDIEGKKICLRKLGQTKKFTKPSFFVDPINIESLEQGLAEIKSLGKDRHIFTANYVEYFLWQGDIKGDEREMPIRIGIGVLGNGFRWFQQEGHFNASWLENRLKKYGPKPAQWWVKYWTFFSLLQGHAIEPFLFNRFSERWEFLCQYDDASEESIVDEWLEQLKEMQNIAVLVSPASEDKLTENHKIIRYFRDETIKLVEEIDPVKRKEAGVFSVPVDSLEKFTLPELSLYRVGEDTPMFNRLSDFKQDFVKRIATFRKLQDNSAQTRQELFLQSVVKSQSGIRYLWLREIIQNCRDAIREANNKISTSVLPIVDISHYYVMDKENNKCHFVVAIRDGAGMNLWQIINYLLSPESSNPEKRALRLTGEFGIGFFTIFADADSVEIRTGKDNGLSYEVCLRPLRAKNGDLVTIEVERFLEFEDKYKGTEVRRIKTYPHNEVIFGHIEDLFLESRLSLFIEGVMAKIKILEKEQLLDDEKEEFIIKYNGEALEQVERELYASIAVNDGESIGNLNLYRQSKAVSKVEQDGLFVGSLKSEWLRYVPEVYQEVIEQERGALILSLPRRAKLTASRDGLCAQHARIVKVGTWALYMYACLYLYLQKNKDISTIPRDFYASASYDFTDPQILQDSDKFNICLGQSENKQKKGEWQTLEVDDAFYFDQIKGRERAIKLLTRIKNPEGVSLQAVAEGAKISANEEFLKRRAADWEKRHEKVMTINNPMTIIKKEEWDAHQHILNDLLGWLYRATGQGFYELVCYEKEEPVLATAGSAKLDSNNSLSWKMRLNVIKKLGNVALWKDALEREVPLELFYSPQAGQTFLEVLVHEYAHVLEYSQCLTECLALLQSINMPSEDYIECSNLIIQHFASLFKEDNGKMAFGNEELVSALKEKFTTLPEQNDKKARVLSRIIERYQIAYNWTHNTDEKLEDSFINFMRRIIEKLLRNRKLKAFPQVFFLSKQFRTGIVPLPDKITEQLDKIIPSQGGKSWRFSKLFEETVYQQLAHTNLQTNYRETLMMLDRHEELRESIPAKKEKLMQYLFAYASPEEIKQIILLFNGTANVRYLEKIIKNLAVLVDFKSSRLMEELRPAINTDSNNLLKKMAKLYGKVKRNITEEKLLRGSAAAITSIHPSTFFSPKLRLIAEESTQERKEKENSI
jgi:hypothetical protein